MWWTTESCRPACHGLAHLISTKEGAWTVAVESEIFSTIISTIEPIKCVWCVYSIGTSGCLIGCIEYNINVLVLLCSARGRQWTAPLDAHARDRTNAETKSNNVEREREEHAKSKRPLQVRHLHFMATPVQFHLIRYCLRLFDLVPIQG